jgi:hypothetical protein
MCRSLAPIRTYYCVWFFLVTMSVGSQQQYFGLAVCNNYGSHEIHGWFAARSRHDPGVQSSMTSGNDLPVHQRSLLTPK